MNGFTTTESIKEMLNKRPMRKRRRNVKKKKKEEKFQKIRKRVYQRNILLDFQELRGPLELVF
tara:strand:+ start:899 stop:1087 length:189 start_codon:yes stop_codon:yes gene_type:complete